MGSFNSKDFSSNEHLLKFAGKEHITSADPFWNSLLGVSLGPPMTRANNILIDHQFTKIFDNLLANNTISGNFGSLLNVFLCRSAQLPSMTDNDTFLWQTYNALLIIRCFTKYMVENGKETNVMKEFDARPLDPAADTNTKPANLVTTEFQNRRLKMFLDALFEIVVEVPLEPETYYLHVEAIYCILVLLSTHMFAQKPANECYIYMNIMQREDAYPSLLVKTLLSFFVRDKGIQTNGGCLMFEIVSGLTFGYGTTYFSDMLPPRQTLLGDQSILLLLVLVNQSTPENLRNPYRDALFNFIDTHSPNSVVSTTAAFRCDLRQLYTTLCNTTMNESSTLMLYLLLNKNLTMKTFILACADIEDLVVPILKTLYVEPDSSGHHLYISVIILLLFSEDSLFNKSVYEITLKNISWYTETALSDVSLGDMIVLVLIRTLHYNITKLRDKCLHINCLAALANMSSNFKHLQMSTSHKLVGLFETLAKKYNQLHLKKKEQVNQNAYDSVIYVAKNVKEESIGDVKSSVIINIGNSKTFEPNQLNPLSSDERINICRNETPISSDLDLTVLEEVLCMILKIINSCLTNQLQHNPNLIYALLYKRHLFEPFKNHSSFRDLYQNLETIIDFFSCTCKLQQQNCDLSVDEVLSTIKLRALQWSTHKLKTLPELKFFYVEEEHPENFFIPYSWSLVYQHSELNWTNSNTSFVPDEDIKV